MILTHYRVSASFDKYGSDIEIIARDGSSFKTKGVIQSISYKNSNNYENVSSDISSVRDMRYMLMTKCDAVMGENDIVKSDGKLYRVLVWQKYIVKNNCIYKWAILKTYDLPQEDDFSA